MKRCVGRSAPMFGVLAVATGASALTPVGPGAFSGAQTVESFEGLSVGPNIPQGSGPGFLVPGSVSDFDFGSGVSLTAPVPNNASVIIGDWALGFASFNLGLNGGIFGASDVPTGSAYIAKDSGDGALFLEFTFDEPQTRVGALVTGFSGDITIEAFNTAGASLGTAALPTVTVADWPTNFLGVEDVSGIKRVRITGDFFVLDDLQFEQVGTTWVEAPDAAQNGINEAQITWGPGLLTEIQGEISNPLDVDVYCIRIADEQNFSASTVGLTGVNTVLHLFDVAGNGVVFNDQDVGNQSTIDSTLVSSNGVYFLSVMSFRTSGLEGSPSDENGWPIFDPSLSSGQQPPLGCPSANRPNCNTISGRLAGWPTAGGSAGGAYGIALTGAEFCANRCPTTLHVPSSFAAISDAIAASVDGDTILVAPGSYSTAGLSPDGRQITIKSGKGPGRTSLVNPAGRVFFIGGNIGPRCRIEGFTITGNTNASGVGAFVDDGAAPMFVDCRFADSVGGAFASTGAFVQNSAAPIFDRCEFVNNSNTNGAAGAGVFSSGFARFANCLFTGNDTSGDGSALIVSSDGAEIFGCTFAGNTGGFSAVAINANTTGANTIIFGNSGSQVVGADPNVQFSHSLFPGGAGTNIPGPPRFVDPANGDYRLGANSPAIDSGQCSLVPLCFDVDDLDGAERLVDNLTSMNIGPSCVNGGPIDMGCYEAHAGTPLPCLGDANGDGGVDFGDITTVLGNWLAICP